MSDLFDLMFAQFSGYPRMGEIKKYRVVDTDDYDLVPKKTLLERELTEIENKIEESKKMIERWQKHVADLEVERKEKQKALR